MERIGSFEDKNQCEYSKEVIDQLLEFIKKEKNIDQVVDTFDLSRLEILGLVQDLRDSGFNIIVKEYDDGFHLLNQGDHTNQEVSHYEFETDENNEFKFVAISDTRLGSKYQQLTILNDIYLKAYEMGYRNVILCGNISEGLFSVTNTYSDTNFLADTLEQVDYITQYYPYVEGMKTYFITGTRDEKHLKNNKINIGKRISDLREDMVYLGNTSCNVEIDKANMLVFSPKLEKTYTVSYRPQQQVDSFRSEDKPDILLYGGLLQMEKMTYRNVKCISVPSVCATTKEMSDKRYANTVGAWYVTVSTDKYGNLTNVRAIDSVYYKTNKDDYTKRKVLKITKDSKGE